MTTPPDMPAVSWLLAAEAAADGCRPVSLSSCVALPSGIMFGKCVGEWFLGVLLVKPSFLLNVLVRLLFGFSVSADGSGGETSVSCTYSGLPMLFS